MTVDELIADCLFEIVTEALRAVPDVPSGKYRQIFLDFISLLLQMIACIYNCLMLRRNRYDMFFLARVCFGNSLDR